MNAQRAVDLWEENRAIKADVARIATPCRLTLVEADGRSMEARYARILFDSPAA
jgi:hypothetical protein